jgi:hypothetical protein
MNDDLQNQINDLRQKLAALSEEFYRNNFSARQDFNKYINFTSRIKVPSYSSLPATCEIGEVIESAGKLRICSATNTWTIVGTQS